MQLVELTDGKRADAERLLGDAVGSLLAAKRLTAAGTVLGVEDGDSLAACVVVDDRGDPPLQLTYIVVESTRRGRGLGRSLVAALRERAPAIRAEATEDAVGFFRKTGFAIESAGGTPYERRYVCTLA